MPETAQFVWEQTFEHGFQRFAEETGRSLHEFMEFEVMRVLVETCYHWTPPPTKGNVGSRGGRLGGQATVTQDIRWAFTEVSDAYLRILEERFGTGPIIGREFRRKDGTVYLIDHVYVNRSGSHDVMARYHQSRRKSNGRVLTHAGSVDENIGRWRPRDKMLVPEGARANYIKSVNVRVGKLKAGWSPALSAVRSSRLPPGWVGKAGATSGASGQASGSYSNQMVGFAGSITATNDTAYFRDLDGFMRRAHSYTEDFFNGPRFDKWLQSVIDKHRSFQTSKGAK